MGYLNSIDEYKKPKIKNRTNIRQTRMTHVTARNINAQLRNDLIKNARKTIKPRAKISSNKTVLHANVSL